MLNVQSADTLVGNVKNNGDLPFDPVLVLDVLKEKGIEQGNGSPIALTFYPNAASQKQQLRQTL